MKVYRFFFVFFNIIGTLTAVVYASNNNDDNLKENNSIININNLKEEITELEDEMDKLSFKTNIDPLDVEKDESEKEDPNNDETNVDDEKLITEIGERFGSSHYDLDEKEKRTWLIFAGFLCLVGIGLGIWFGNLQPEEDYYEMTVSGSTIDISDPLKYVKNKTGLEYYKGCFYMIFSVGMVLYYGLRIDYLFKKGYMDQHKMYYSCWVVLILGIDIIFNYLTLWKEILGTDLLWPSIFLAATMVYYYGGNTLFFLVLKKPLTRRLGKAKVIMLYEVLVSTMWVAVGIGLRAFAISVDVVEFPEAIPEVVTTIGGLVVLFIGYFFKGWACVLTGINSYYWRDMVTEIPNSHFVESSLYAYFSHPTYTIGYLPGLSVGIYYRSIEGIVAYIILQILILLFVHIVEEPFINRMYKSNVDVVMPENEKNKNEHDGNKKSETKEEEETKEDINK